jgi:hypothetical protein
VWVNSGSSFDKTGGTIYGDTDTTHLLGDINNTVTAAGSFPTSGNAVYYAAGHYRDGPLGVWDDIHTSATGSPWDD